MTRVLPAVAAGVICGVAGMRQAADLRRGAAELRRWEALLRHLALLMQSQAAPLPDVMQQAACEATGPDRRIQALAAALREHPLQTLGDLYAASPAAGPAHPVLLRLTARLGHGSLDSRILAVNQAADEMALLADGQAGKAAKDARMWSQLGWAVGACLTLLLI